jgi:hypothetical protein
MRSIGSILLVIVSAVGAAAQSMNDDAFGRHVMQNYKAGSPQGKPAEIAIRVVALPTGDLVATRIPVPPSDDGWANSHLLIGCDQIPETKPWTAYRLVARSDFAHFDDTEAYETRQAPRFTVMLQGCRLAAEPRTDGGEDVKERNIALRNGLENLRIGPTFVCADWSKCPGLARVVLTESAAPHALGRADVALVQPYQILRHALPSEQQRLRIESGKFSEAVVRECRIPKRFANEDPHGNAEGTDRYAPCVANAYTRQRTVWLAAVDALGIPGAAEEARRDPGEHWFLQSLLKFHGFLPEDTRIDGSYGAATRNAIAVAQTRAGLPADGYMDDAVALWLTARP